MAAGDEPRVVLAEERAGGGAEQAAAAADERRMLRKERGWSLLFIAMSAGLGWLEWKEITTEHTFSAKGVIVVVMMGLIGPVTLVWPKLLVGMGRTPERVAPIYRVVGFTFSIVALAIGAGVAWYLTQIDLR